MSINIGSVDAAIVIVYMLAVLTLGVWIGRGRQTAARYFLGDRSLPWGAVLLSIVATETSTVTFLSIPGLAAAAGGNLTFLQITIGYIVGRLGVIFVLLPLYFRGQPFTAYEVLETRFGTLSRRLVSSLFLLTRNASDALRLFLTALVLQIVLGLDLGISVIVIVILVAAKAQIAKRFIQCECRSVIAGDLQPHDETAAVTGGTLTGLDEASRNAQATEARVGGDGIQSCQTRATVVNDKDVPGQRIVNGSYQEGPLVAADPVTETAPAEAVGTECGLFQPHQVRQIITADLAQAGAAAHDCSPCMACRMT